VRGFGDVLVAVVQKELCVRRYPCDSFGQFWLYTENATIPVTGSETVYGVVTHVIQRVKRRVQHNQQ
jgi:hypothetical protein